MNLSIYVEKFYYIIKVFALIEYNALNFLGAQAYIYARKINGIKCIL